jgi:hypothetical protein
MDDPVAHALEFVRNFAELAERLAKRNIVVRRLRCDWSGFGSWTVEASSGDAESKRSSAIHRHAFNEAGPEVCRVIWDGEDRQLSMGSTPTQVSVMINQWRNLEPQSCNSSEARAHVGRGVALCPSRVIANSRVAEPIGYALLHAYALRP